MEAMKLLRPVPESAAAARGFVERTLGAWGCDELVDDARVVASELVTNVIRHAHTPTVVTLTRRADRVRLAVADGAPITARVGASGQDPDALDDGRGHGLVLVKALSDDWGVDLEPEGKSVWAEWDTARTSAAIRSAPSAVR